MKVVIDIPDYNLDEVQNGSIACGMILNAVKNGTVLPKGHGRLIDADKLKVNLVKTYEKVPTEKALLFVSLLLDNNEEVPTVIEGDKE